MKLHPGYEQRPTDSKFVDCVYTPLSEEEATYYLNVAWKKIYGVYPSKNSLALLWAQSAGETGRWKFLRCNNWGNIKKRDQWHWTSYEAGEVLNGKHQMFYPYHPQTHFAAWESAIDGAEAYIRFLSERQRYKKAWIELMAGDPVAYCKELKAAGYFTADLAHYTKGVVRLTTEFKNKYDRLISWEPERLPEPETKSSPEVTPEPEIVLEPAPIEPKQDPMPEPVESKTVKKSFNLDFISKILEMLKNLLIKRG